MDPTVDPVSPRLPTGSQPKKGQEASGPPAKRQRTGGEKQQQQQQQYDNCAQLGEPPAWAAQLLAAAGEGWEALLATDQGIVDVLA